MPRTIPETTTISSILFDCLHDMGDPICAARHVRQTLKADGTWMIVEPMAQDRLEDNRNFSRKAILRGFYDDLAFRHLLRRRLEQR